MEIAGKAKRQENSGTGLPLGKILLAVVVLLICGVMAFIGSRMVQDLETLRDDLTNATTGYEARGLITGIMGAPLPERATDFQYRSAGFMDSITTTLKFSIAPEAYANFIASANPGERYGKCLSLPLQPEGKQPQKPECYGNSMTISVDKSNAALWRVTIKIHESV